MGGRLQHLENWIKNLSTNPHIEIVLVHDFFDIKTSEELKAICLKYENLELVEGHFGNPGSARNAGLDVCRGKWIVFWDSDDEPLVDNFLALLKFVMESNSDICFGRYQIFNEISGALTESPYWSSDPKENLEIVAQNPGIWRVTFERELLAGVSFEPLKMAEDQIFMSEVLSKSRQCSFFNIPVYKYFTGSPNHLTKNENALQDLLPAFRKSTEILKNSRADLTPFIRLMAAKQFLSGCRHGNIKTKSGLLRELFKTGLIFSPQFLISLKRVIQKAMLGI